MSWFKSILGAAESIGGWMETNSTAASILSGAAVGAADYYAQKDARKAQEKHDNRMYERRRSDQLERSMASSGSASSGYGNHATNLAGGTGLLTNGRFANKQ